MSEQVDMVDITTKPDEYVDLVSVCKSNNMVDKHHMNDKTTSASKIHISNNL